ncbi:MAG: PqiC family protein [Syntrophobacteraceae bacterium]|nr:PqiC family protein [Syntrophobacteraceae bacterium]
MPMRHLGLAVFVLICCTGCLGGLFTGTRPAYFELSYEAHGPRCSGTRQGSVRIWPFSAASPYDREEMIILEPSRKVRFSRHFRWITSPGSMIADKLTRDLAEDGPFARVLAAASPAGSDTQLSGHVHQFAWEDLGEGSQQARLDVQVSVWREEPRRAVVLSRRYRLESRRLEAGSPEKFAEVMSQMVAELSIRLREDLCAMASGSSSLFAD